MPWPPVALRLPLMSRLDGRMIGSSRFHGYDEERSEVEIGWTFLAGLHSGGTYNADMKRLTLDHAFRFVSSVVLFVGRQTCGRSGPWRRSTEFAWVAGRGPEPGQLCLPNHWLTFRTTMRVVPTPQSSN
jgi:hypothetical protein